MSRIKTLQALFKRYRRPGDIVFAWVVLLVAILLLIQITNQTAWRDGSKLVTQPRFWPAVSLGGMTIFALFHLLGSIFSERIAGRWQEVGLWTVSLEYAIWFVVYAATVPYAGYLPTTLIFAVALTFRVGYRSQTLFVAATGSAIAIVVLFKSLLQVKLPAGLVYEILPSGLRQIMLSYF